MSWWNDERVAKLRELSAQGLSASEICRRIGAPSRSAVVAKRHRLGISVTVERAAAVQRATGSSSGRRRKAPPGARETLRAIMGKPEAKPVPPVEPTAFTAKSETLTPTVDLAGLGPHMCKWPIGDPRDSGFGFCGRPANGNYCGTHFERAYTPESRKAAMQKGGAERFLDKIARRYA
jgi:GcrA cell cycle regulator